MVRFVLVVLLSVSLVGCARYNFREVEPGGLYRSGQMPSAELGRVLDEYGIRAVVNLRGENPDEDWYEEEVSVCAERGVAHYNLDWSMKRLPTPDSLQRFVNIVETAQRPILVHCQGGTHRAAIGAACYLLLMNDPVEDARRQLGPLFGDAPIGGLLDLYEGSTLPFAEWVDVEYPVLYDAWLERDHEDVK